MRLIILTIYAICLLNAPAYGQTAHVVSDIDSTLVGTKLDHSENLLNLTLLKQVEGYDYYVFAGTPELLTYIRDNKIKLSFYSGGTSRRNEILLKKLKSFEGHSAYSISSGDIYSKHNLTKDQKKDLRVVTENLEDVVMLDDRSDFMHPSQQDHFIWLRIDWPFKSAEEFENKVQTLMSSAPAKDHFEGLQYIRSWKMHFNLSIFTIGFLDQALQNARTQNIPFDNAAMNLRRDLDKPENNSGLLNKLILRGYRIAKAINPGLKHVTYKIPAQCQIRLANLKGNTHAD